MLERGKVERGVFEIVDTESLVSEELFLRKIDAPVNFSNEDREAHGKKPFEDDDQHNVSPNTPKKKRDNTSKKTLKKRKKQEKMKTVIRSTTDPNCGMFVNGDRKK